MTARITIDGRACTVRAGADLLSVCLAEGMNLPYFCWHGALGSVGACRQCAVRVHAGPEDAEGRIVMACMTGAAEGQRVAIADPEAVEFRARVAEWLLLNHPHDCPVCPEAGSCHLQDMVVATGHRTRRTRFPKRTHRNQDLGPLLTHEMNRCIACYRCTRFYRDHAGGRDLEVFGAHDHVWFGRAADGPLDSPFAGNLAEVCPTGVFNDRGWVADYARKWDMPATPSVCPHCALGCNIYVSERAGRVRRVQNRYHGALNGYFICDRGRYGPLYTGAPQRLATPLLAGTAAPAEAAMAASRALLAGRPIGLGSPRASMEANFALRQLVGAERFHMAVSDAEAALLHRMLAMLRAGPAQIASLADVAAADAALVLGEDLTNAAPMLALALRQMARGAERALAAAKGVPAWLDPAVRVAGEGRRSPIVLATPVPDALEDIAAAVHRLDPVALAEFAGAVAAGIGDGAAGGGHNAADAAGNAIADADNNATAHAEASAAAATAHWLAAAERPLVIAGAGLGSAAIVEAAAAIAAALGPRARLVLLPPEANSLGLALLGGGGLESATAMLAAGEAQGVLLLEADLFERAPRAAVEPLLAAAGPLLALDSLHTASTARADIALPVASFAEAAGTFVNFEGRAQRFFAAVPEGPPAAWRVLAALGAGPWPSLDALLTELEAELPGIAAAAPGAGFTTPAGPPTRSPRPLTGRTADDRAGRLPEAAPPADPDSPLGWGMEGARGAAVPPALRPAVTSPGLHSANAVTRFEAESGGPLRGGDPGALLLAPGAGPPPPAAPVTPINGQGLLLVPLHDAFSGWEPSRASPLLAARAPAPRLLLHPEDAAALGLHSGDSVLLDGLPCPVPLWLDPGLARGVVAASIGTLVPRGPLRRVSLAPAR